MGIKLYREPKLEKPIMFVGWPGIGNIGIIAVNTLKGILRGEELGEIEVGISSIRERFQSEMACWKI